MPPEALDGRGLAVRNCREVDVRTYEGLSVAVAVAVADDWASWQALMALGPSRCRACRPSTLVTTSR